MTNELMNYTETADGSKTIYNAAIDEHYHSRNGALQESRHVFVHSGLEHFLANNTVDEVSILEVGFGTGLNFLLTADHCLAQKIKLSYTGIEAWPLPAGTLSQSGYDAYTHPQLWAAFNQHYTAALHAQVPLNAYTELYIAHTPLLQFKSQQQFNLIYFDAFASAKQPEMWTDEAIAHTLQFLKPGGIFVTYAITGNLKRAIKALGCKVEKTPGAAGKREMLRATKPR